MSIIEQEPKVILANKELKTILREFATILSLSLLIGKPITLTEKEESLASKALILSKSDKNGTLEILISRNFNFSSNMIDFDQTTITRLNAYEKERFIEDFKLLISGITKRKGNGWILNLKEFHSIKEKLK